MGLGQLPQRPVLTLCVCMCVCMIRCRCHYRKLAQQWHPDNFATGDEKDKKKSEAMFIDIAAAKEVLSDPGTRIDRLRGLGGRGKCFCSPIV